MADDTALTVNSTGVPAGAVRRGIDESTWNALCHSVYPGARPESILLVIDYCRARGLDPLKKPAHIVPMRVKDAKTQKYEWRDVILPGIYEHRMTAQKTGEYLGHSAATWGPEVNYKGVLCPEWCELTIYRYHPKAEGKRIAFTVRSHFREVVTLNDEGKPNARWSRAPVQMLLKCTEAAGLREAFPDELGGEMTAEEMHGAKVIDTETTTTTDAPELPPAPEGYEAWVRGLEAAADKGTDSLREAWKTGAVGQREYVTRSDLSLLNTLRHRASIADAPPSLATEPAPAPAATEDPA